jgi:peptidoglycan/xylan/chitin deacetylase (PgdA/CDA1 family)
MKAHSFSWILLWSLLFVSVLAVGAVFIRLNFFIRSIHHGSRESNQLALSFDDGPAQQTARILDILKNENVAATFFCIGKNVDAAPELVNRCVDEGHLIGNHSYLHGKLFDLQSGFEMEKEIKKTNDSVLQITGKKMRLFRPPYGVTNPSLAYAVRKTEMESIGWSLRSFDTQAKNADHLLNKILKQVKGGDVILLHDSMQVTADMLPVLIRSCREKGFTFVRLDKLLELNAYA